jgi:hypothetical protein
MRHRFGIPNARGQIPPAPSVYGRTIPSGQRVEFKLGRNALTNRRMPHRIPSDGSKEQYVVEAGEGEHVLQKRMKRLRQQHDPDRFEVRGHVEAVADAEEEV